MFYHKFFLKYKLIFLIICLFLINQWLLTATGVEQENVGRRTFYNIAELIKIIEKARKAGFSDEDLKKLELRDGDRKINVIDYIEEFERIKKSQDRQLQIFLKKKFLTVKDIFNELVNSEPEVIKKLREELVSER